MHGGVCFASEPKGVPSHRGRRASPEPSSSWGDPAMAEFLYDEPKAVDLTGSLLTLSRGGSLADGAHDPSRTMPSDPRLAAWIQDLAQGSLPGTGETTWPSCWGPLSRLTLGVARRDCWELQTDREPGRFGTGRTADEFSDRRRLPFDADNTLFDNDRFRQDLRERLASPRTAITPAPATGKSWTSCGTSWAIWTISARSCACGLKTRRPRDLHTANWIVDYPFADRLYPHALDVVNHFRQWGLPVLLTDGDAILQPRKIMRSGLWKAFDDNVLIYIHKEKELDDVARRYPAPHYASSTTRPAFSPRSSSPGAIA